MKLVRLKVFHREDGAGEFNVKQLSQTAAERLIASNPRMYQLIEPPKIQVTKLEPIPQEKKSVPPAESEVVEFQANVTMKTETLNAGENGTIPSTAHISQPPDKQTTEEVIRKRGRPKLNP